jgi:GNAT superfamily N-acetyltransferase
MSSEYRVNKSTGKVVKDDGTGWKPVASVRNKTTGEILIDEGNGWQPMPGAQRTLQADRGMTMASERANQAMASGQRIAPDDLTKLGQPDFSTAAMARLPAPTMNTQQLDAFDAQKRAKDEAMRVPDSDFKERSIIAMNVPTFGSGPRLAAGAQTLGALAATPFIEGDIIDREGISGAADQFLDEARIHQRRAREERPLESIGTEVGLGLLQGKTIVDTLGKRLLPQANTVANVARTVGVGTGYGALYAGSQNESGTLEGVAQDAAFGGTIGGISGGVLKGAEAPARVTYRAGKEAAATISDALSDLLGKAGGARDKVADEVAIAAVRRSMERSGLNINQIMDLVKRYEGKPAVLAEVIGQDAINALTALTRRPGSTPQKAQDLIEERFYGRPDRMKADVEDATGIQIGQLDDTLGTQLEARQEAAKPIYDALYKQFSTVKSFGESLKRINRIARTPAMQKHLKLAEEAVKTQAALRQVPISKMSKMEYWDLVKRSLDDEINSAVAKGEARTKVGASVADLTQLKKAITDEFDRLTDGAYAAAREAGGEAPRLRAAATAGQKALQARNPREVAKTVAATLSQDLPALRAGIVDDLGTRIDKGMTPGRVRVPDVAGKLRAGLGDEAGGRLINRFDAEAALSETGARWAPRMNSVTGTVMESGATQMGDDLINAGMNLATGNKVGLVRQAINFMRQRGFSQRQIDAIGDLLLSSPEEGLRRLKLMAPEGVPGNTAAPIAGAGGPDGLPPGGGGITPQAAQAASATPAGPIRAAGFGGDLGNALAGAGLGGIAPADSTEERIGNIGAGAALGFGARRLGKAMGSVEDGARRTVGGPRVASAGVPKTPSKKLPVGFSIDATQRGVGGTYTAMVNGKKAGEMVVDWRGPFVSLVKVEPSQQRAGIASALYDAVEADIGRPVIPSPLGISPSAQKFWESRLARYDNPKKIVDESIRLARSLNTPKYARDNLEALKQSVSGQQKFRPNYVAEKLPAAKLPDYGYDELRLGKASVEVTRVDDNMTINRIKVPEGSRGQGEASRALDAVLQQADQQGVTTFLKADPVGTGGMTQPQLEAFYKSRGFVSDGADGMIRKPASPILTAGAGGGRKPPTGKPSRLGTRTADAAAIAALGIAPPAQGQSGASAELEAAKQRVTQIETQEIPRLESDLRLLEAPDTDAKVLQDVLQRRGFDLGPAGIDGRIGPDTRKAIAENVKQIRQDIETQRKELEQARKNVTQQEMRAAQAAAQPNTANDIFGKAAPWIGAAAGVYLGYRTRGGAVKKSQVAAAEAAKKANALLNANPVTRGVNTPNSVNTRAANLNEFWRQGGAGESVPFRANQSGKWSARPKASEPSQLFGPPARYNSKDAAIIATGGAEAGVAHMGVREQDAKIKQAKADVERYAEAGDVAGMQRALKQQKDAETMRNLFIVAERAGLLLSASRITAGLSKPYAKVAPDIAAAERERALVLQALKK